MRGLLQACDKVFEEVSDVLDGRAASNLAALNSSAKGHRVTESGSGWSHVSDEDDEDDDGDTDKLASNGITQVSTSKSHKGMSSSVTINNSRSKDINNSTAKNSNRINNSSEHGVSGASRAAWTHDSDLDEDNDDDDLGEDDNYEDDIDDDDVEDDDDDVRGVEIDDSRAEDMSDSRKLVGRENLLSKDELQADRLLEAVAGEDHKYKASPSPVTLPSAPSSSGNTNVAAKPAVRYEDMGWLEVPLDIEAYWLLQEVAWEVQAEEDRLKEEEEEEEATVEKEVQNLEDTTGGDDNSENDAPSQDLVDGVQGANGVSVSSDVDETAAEVEPQFSVFKLRVVGVAGRTGFEETKELKVHKGMRIAGRYEVEDVVGEAAFSTALRCIDIEGGKRPVCCKVIKNNKDFVDQSLDEIRLLQHLNERDPDATHVVHLLDYFYHKEHLFLVTELLGADLFAGWIQVTRTPGLSLESAVFTVAKQCLAALEFVHKCGLIHCDIKPENILIAAINPLRVKLIDFGSSCFVTDRMSSYIQSRFYRAPEVVLGLPFSTRIDLWSLGCVLTELLTGQVLFECADAHELLAMIISALGPIPRHMASNARYASKFFLGDVLHRPPEDVDYETASVVSLLYPKQSSLSVRLPRSTSAEMRRLLERLLKVDPALRPSAEDLLRSEFTA